MDTQYELTIDGHTIVSTFNVHEFLIARKSALMALHIAGITWDNETFAHDTNVCYYYIERVHTKA